MKTRFLSVFTLCGVLGASGFSAQALETPSVQANVNVTTAPVSGAPRYSGRINDVVALAQSGVDQSVVLSFIKTSPGPFQPSADEIIKLRDAGISSDVITAMMQRGAELREQAVASAAQQQTYAQSSTSYTQPAQQVQAAPAQTQSWPPPYVDPTYYPTYYSAPSSVVYIGGSYGYPYSYYYPFYSSYCYPYRYYRPYYYSHAGYYGSGLSFSFGAPFGFHGGYGGYRGGYGGYHGGYGGYRGGYGGGFHGGPVHVGGGGFRGGGGFHGGGGSRH